MYPLFIILKLISLSPGYLLMTMYMDKGGVEMLQKLVQPSFMKIANSKHGQPNLLKNLLVLHLLQKVRRYFIYFYLFDYRQNTTKQI